MAHFSFEAEEITECCVCEELLTKLEREDVYADGPNGELCRVCTECMARNEAESNAEFRRYMNGVEYACGIRD